MDDHKVITQKQQFLSIILCFFSNSNFFYFRTSSTVITHLTFVLCTSIWKLFNIRMTKRLITFAFSYGSSIYFVITFLGNFDPFTLCLPVLKISKKISSDYVIYGCSLSENLNLLKWIFNCDEVLFFTSVEKQCMKLHT